jgi:hypothetical protein
MASLDHCPTSEDVAVKDPGGASAVGTDSRDKSDAVKGMYAATAVFATTTLTVAIGAALVDLSAVNCFT